MTGVRNRRYFVSRRIRVTHLTSLTEPEFTGIESVSIAWHHGDVLVANGTTGGEPRIAGTEATKVRLVLISEQNIGV